MPDRNTEDDDDNSEGTAEGNDVLNEEFESYRRVAESLILTLKRPRDIEVGHELIRLCESLKNSKIFRIKKAANEFFKLLLKILNWTSNNQPHDVYKNWFQESSGVVPQTTNWMEKNKSYLASTTLDDGSIIIYSAVSANVDAGWQEHGLKILYLTKESDKK